MSYSTLVAGPTVVKHEILDGSTTGSVNGTEQYGAGPFGRQAFLCNGSSDIDFGNIAQFPDGTDFTFAIRLSEPSDPSAIYYPGGQGGSYPTGFAIQRNTSGFAGYAGWQPASSITVNPDNGSFVSVILRYNLSGNDQIISALGESKTTYNNGTSSTATNFTIGSRDGFLPCPSGVLIAEFIIDNKFWSSDEIAAWEGGPEPINITPPKVTASNNTLSWTLGTWEDPQNTSLTYAVSIQKDGSEVATATAAGSIDLRDYTKGSFRVSVTASNEAGSPSLPATSNSIDYSGYGVYELLKNRWPVGGQARCENDIAYVSKIWNNAAPLIRDTVLYFDADEGDDSNDGLSLERPKQSISAMNSALAQKNITIRAKGTWRTNTRIILPADTTLTSWNKRLPPRFTGLRLRILKDTDAWTQINANRWTATLANAASLHPDSWDIFKSLTIAASTTEVENNPNSYYINSSTIHLNFDGIDPNTESFGCNHSGDTGSSLSAIEIQGTARVDNIIADHNGFGTGFNQSYGIIGNHTGNHIAVIKNVKCANHHYHNIGTLSLANGRTLVERAEFGGCTDNQATHLNFFSTGGGNQAIARKCICKTDRTPSVGMSERNEQSAIYGHSTSSNKLDFVATVDLVLDPNGQDPPQDFGRINDIGGSRTAIEDNRAIHIRGKCSPSFASRTVPLMTEDVYVACDFSIQPAYWNALCVTNLGAGGWFLASVWEVDWKNIITSTTYGAYILGRQTPTQIVNSNIFWKNIPAGDTVMIFRTGGTNDNWGLDCLIANNTWVCQSAGNAMPGIGNVNSTDGTYTHNAFYDFTDELTGERGYSEWENTIELTSPLNPRAANRDLLSAGSVAAGAFVEVDGSGFPLVNPGASIGPWGPARYPYGPPPRASEIKDMNDGTFEDVLDVHKEIDRLSPIVYVSDNTIIYRENSGQEVKNTGPKYTQKRFEKINY